jgi:hypothetical protein
MEQNNGKLTFAYKHDNYTTYPAIATKYIIVKNCSTKLIIYVTCLFLTLWARFIFDDI